MSQIKILNISQNIIEDEGIVLTNFLEFIVNFYERFFTFVKVTFKKFTKV